MPSASTSREIGFRVLRLNSSLAVGLPVFHCSSVGIICRDVNSAQIDNADCDVLPSVCHEVLSMHGSSLAGKAPVWLDKVPFICKSVDGLMRRVCFRWSHAVNGGKYLSCIWLVIASLLNSVNQTDQFAWEAWRINWCSALWIFSVAIQGACILGSSQSSSKQPTASCGTFTWIGDLVPSNMSF